MREMKGAGKIAKWQREKLSSQIQNCLCLFCLFLFFFCSVSHPHVLSPISPTGSNVLGRWSRTKSSHKQIVGSRCKGDAGETSSN